MKAINAHKTTMPQLPEILQISFFSLVQGKNTAKVKEEDDCTTQGWRIAINRFTSELEVVGNDGKKGKEGKSRVSFKGSARTRGK